MLPSTTSNFIKNLQATILYKEIYVEPSKVLIYDTYQDFLENRLAK